MGESKIIRERQRVHGECGTYTEPAVLKCKCGAEFELVDQYCGACDCPQCGSWYNLFGQSLLPPEQWGWDDTPMDEDY